MDNDDESLWRRWLHAEVMPLARARLSRSKAPMPLPESERAIRQAIGRKLGPRPMRMTDSPDERDRPPGSAPRRKGIEARLDLHGTPEAEAYRLLTEFIEQATALGCERLLIVTGKGRDPGGPLKRNVPRWLEVPPLSAQIASCRPAEARHGGEGALYVTLRPPTRKA